MKKQTLMISFVASVILIATFTSIATSIDGNTATTRSESNVTTTNDLTSILESALSDADGITLEELAAAEVLLQNAKIENLQDPLPDDPGIKFKCEIWKYLIDQLDYWYEYYHNLFYSEKVQNILDCENNIDTCQMIEDALTQILELRESINKMYQENNCDGLGEEIQSLPAVEGSTATAPTSTPTATTTTSTSTATTSKSTSPPTSR